MLIFILSNIWSVSGHNPNEWTILIRTKKKCFCWFAHRRHFMWAVTNDDGWAGWVNAKSATMPLRIPSCNATQWRQRQAKIILISTHSSLSVSLSAGFSQNNKVQFCKCRHHFTPMFTAVISLIISNPFLYYACYLTTVLFVITRYWHSTMQSNYNLFSKSPIKNASLGLGLTVWLWKPCV